jgi:hypothetical protein
MNGIHSLLRAYNIEVQQEILDWANSWWLEPQISKKGCNKDEDD